MKTSFAAVLFPVKGVAASLAVGVFTGKGHACKPCNHHQIALGLTDLIMMHGTVEGAKEVVDARLVTHGEKETVGQRLVMEGRDSLKGRFGYVHSDIWSTVGLPTSLEVPKRASRLIPVMETMRLFYANHPELEIATRNITAVKIGEALDAVKNAKAALTAQRTILRTLRSE